MRPTIPASLTVCAPAPEATYPTGATSQLTIAEWIVRTNRDYKDCVDRLQRVTCLARGDCQ